MYYIQVYVSIRPGVREWKYLQPTNGARYAYKTEAYARKIANMCYPLTPDDEVRIVDK